MKDFEIKSNIFNTISCLFFKKRGKLDNCFQFVIKINGKFDIFMQNINKNITQINSLLLKFEQEEKNLQVEQIIKIEIPSIVNLLEEIHKNVCS